MSVVEASERVGCVNSVLPENLTPRAESTLGSVPAPMLHDAASFPYI
jgi:hypothetical protein